ncbi:uncharacterized protein LOC134235824 [Saccostrea cucullata]|uniref:uncharacterized protein LOC134235824 n=1 Tax=Saccostrea cuccullata TaxID=36930 RepID=UPI002ED1DD30
MSSITVPGVDDVYHISCVTSERLWVSDQRRLLQVDKTTPEVQENKIDFKYYSPRGSHSVSEDGNLILIDGYEVQKMTLDGTITTLLRESRRLLCIHSSRINGDILVGFESGLKRYDWSGAHHIKLGTRSYFRYGDCYPIFITENKNGDIWVSDRHREVVVMDKLGQHRFNYRGLYKSDFYPCGICTDILGQVLVCDAFDPSIHLVDQNGQFLRHLLTEEHGLRCPMALCVDEKHNLYVGEKNSNTITVYKYLQETENLKSSIIESK